MLTNFEHIQETAYREWEAFTTPPYPRIIIGTATCGRAAGALRVHAAFQKALVTYSIEADVQNVGCLGLCYAEPLVEITLPGGRRLFYANVTEKMAKKLVKDVLVGVLKCIAGKVKQCPTVLDKLTAFFLEQGFCKAANNTGHWVESPASKLFQHCLAQVSHFDYQGSKFWQFFDNRGDVTN